MQHFEAIRPYCDEEVPSVIDALLQNEALLKAIIHVQFPRTPRYLEPALAKFLKLRLHRTLKDVNSVADFQQHTMKFVDKIIQKSITEFSVEGLGSLESDQSYVFISNHRDITLDSALLNYALMDSGRESAQIAIGDNLVQNPLVSDLMRLNKSFVVERSVSGLKARLLALTNLSRYIHDIRGDGHSIWIAQREGRAKTGSDKTDPAIIKMLYLWFRKQGLSFTEAVQRMNIVPVAISYEYDPCDGLKATELDARERAVYSKGENDDLESIMRGIMLPKGRVHLAIGKPLIGEGLESPLAVAEAVDSQIIQNYKLFPISWFATEQLLGLGKLQEMAIQVKDLWSNVDAQDLAQQAVEFSSRVSQYPAEIQRYILQMYANPLLNKCQLALP